MLDIDKDSGPWKPSTLAMAYKMVYLGDSVYVGSDGRCLAIMTDTGQGPTNLIYLEQKVFKALVEHGKKFYDIK